MEIIIVAKGSPDELAAAINEKFRNRWKLQGEMFVFNGNVCQAMIRVPQKIVSITKKNKLKI